MWNIQYLRLRLWGHSPQPNGIFAFRRIRTPKRTLALRKFPMQRIDANISKRAPRVRFVALRWWLVAYSFKQDFQLTRYLLM